MHYFHFGSHISIPQCRYSSDVQIKQHQERITFITIFMGPCPVGRQVEGRFALADTLDMPRRTSYDDSQLVLLGKVLPSTLYLLKKRLTFLKAERAWTEQIGCSESALAALNIMHALRKGASPLLSRLCSRVIATSAAAESAPATAAATKAPLNREVQVYR